MFDIVEFIDCHKIGNEQSNVTNVVSLNLDTCNISALRQLRPVAIVFLLIIYLEKNTR